MKRIIVILIMFLFALSCEKDDSKDKKYIYTCIINFTQCQYPIGASLYDFCAYDEIDATSQAKDYCMLFYDNCLGCDIECSLKLNQKTECNWTFSTN